MRTKLRYGESLTVTMSGAATTTEVIAAIAHAELRTTCYR